MENRGLLTEDDRAYYRGEKETDDPEKVGREKRHYIRQRIQNLVVDLELLAAAGEDELIDDFHANTDRAAKLETQVAALQEQLAALEEDEATDSGTDEA